MLTSEGKVSVVSDSLACPSGNGSKPLKTTPTSMSKRQSPQPQVTGSVTNTPQRELDGLDSLVDHHVHGAVLLVLLLLLLVVLELLVALWYWSIALEGNRDTMRQHKIIQQSGEFIGLQNHTKIPNFNSCTKSSF